MTGTFLPHPNNPSFLEVLASFEPHIEPFRPSPELFFVFPYQFFMLEKSLSFIVFNNQNLCHGLFRFIVPE
jgi:hypothetical protein